MTETEFVALCAYWWVHYERLAAGEVNETSTAVWNVRGAGEVAAEVGGER